MSRKAGGVRQGPSDGARTSRRKVLKGALAILGAGVLIQPNGGVSGLAFASGEKPLESSAAKTGLKSGVKTGAKMDLKTGAKSGLKSGVKTGAGMGLNTGAKSGVKLDSQSSTFSKAQQ
jgi:hypothetical protein